MPMVEYSASSGFPEPFVLYLARFILRYDATSATWLRSVGDALPSWWDERERQQTLSEQVATFDSDTV